MNRLRRNVFFHVVTKHFFNIKQELPIKTSNKKKPSSLLLVELHCKCPYYPPPPRLRDNTGRVCKYAITCTLRSLNPRRVLRRNSARANVQCTPSLKHPVFKHIQTHPVGLPIFKGVYVWIFIYLQAVLHPFIPAFEGDGKSCLIYVKESCFVFPTVFDFK